MLDIHELESRWLKYKLKSYLPYIVISVSSTVILVAGYTLYNSNIAPTTFVEKEIEKPIVIIKKQVQEIEPKIVEIKEVILAKPLKIEKVTLKPSMDFIEKIRINPTPYSEKRVIDIPKKKIQEKKELQEEKVKKEPKVDKKESASINIKRQNTYEDINHVIGRFNNNNNPALSLFVAKKYYEMGEYKKAYNYALITNDINNNIETSWIIFAKSLVKLGKKDMAVNTLHKYINHSKSNKAKILLDEIISGKFNDN